MLHKNNKTKREQIKKGECTECGEHMCILCGKPEKKDEPAHTETGLCGKCSSLRLLKGVWKHRRCSECNGDMRDYGAEVRDKKYKADFAAHDHDGQYDLVGPRARSMRITR